ncbi:GYF domain-containing protein [Hyphococcus flavus]|uniref:GYF domain-containing protein n=1 Tax=Hyphococcus flavus TaxID=1866326 RepID=A0AAE9ZF14_9PROT|nr:GYF domain-containing protein [Hyphococcus flavus]WDI31653.1 GYF domain-containing protein [Hyphococcus flavus]
MLAAENWCLKVEDKVYGPYTSEQMRKFAHEGRLAPWSMIAPAGGRSWREARSEAVFANFFGVQKTPGPKKEDKVFGKRNDWDDDFEKQSAPANDKPANSPNQVRQTQNRKQHEIQAANFILIFDVVSGAASRVEAAVLSLGQAFRIADNVWSVSCELTAVGVRNAIAPYLRGSESIFVVDATRGRTSWRNYAPETQSKITAAYLTARVA